MRKSKPKPFSSVVYAEQIVTKSIRLVDGHDRPRIVLYVDEDAGFAAISMNDENGSPRIRISLMPEGQPAITLRSADDKIVVMLTAYDSDNVGVLTLGDQEGQKFLDASKIRLLDMGIDVAASSAAKPSEFPH